jgi:hypothetical protein
MHGVVISRAFFAGHYFGAGAWTCDHTSREGVKWLPEYDMPLGAPLAAATLDASTGIYRRQFAFGTNVSYDSKLDTGSIEWGKFPQQPQAQLSGESSHGNRKLN